MSMRLTKPNPTSSKNNQQSCTDLYEGILPNEMMRLATVISPLTRDLRDDNDGTLPSLLRLVAGFLRFCCTAGLLRLDSATHGYY